MKIVLLHMHFVMYWRPRIRALAQVMACRAWPLNVLEVAGKDSTYPFALPTETANTVAWRTLFPAADCKILTPSGISSAIDSQLDELDPHVVISTAIAFPTGAAAVRWARRRKRGVVIMDNARLQDVPRSRIVNFVKRRIYRNVDAVLIPAPSHDASYTKWGIARERIFYGLNVIDNAWYEQATADARTRSAAIRQHRELPERFFLGVGRQLPFKNWEGLLFAFHKYRNETARRPWDLVLVGDGPARPSLEAVVSEHRIQGVHLHPACAPESVCDYYATASAVVLPSTHGETWGLVVNEAMASGLPVLVSEECGCAPCLVSDGENGWRFPPRNHNALAAVLERMAGASDTQRAAMAARSREIIAQWSLERFAQGAIAAAEASSVVSRGYASVFDRILLNHWKGRFRPL